MKESFLKELTNFGFSDKEAKIYIGLLELEIATAFEVAKHTGINRSSAYVILESLKKKGYVGISEEKKVTRYLAASPEILLQSAKAKAAKEEQVKNGIESILPELKALHKDTKIKPIVKIFEGPGGIVSLFEDSINCKIKEIRLFSSLEEIRELLPDYVIHYVKTRINKGIAMKSIHPLNNFFNEYNKINLPKIDSPVFIPKSKYKNHADFAIYDDKIAYMSADKGGYGILIESKEMAEVMKNVFDLAYEESKRLSRIKE